MKTDDGWRFETTGNSVLAIHQDEVTLTIKGEGIGIGEEPRAAHVMDLVPLAVLRHALVLAGPPVEVTMATGVRIGTCWHAAISKTSSTLTPSRCLDCDHWYTDEHGASVTVLRMAPPITLGGKILVDEQGRDGTADVIRALGGDPEREVVTPPYDAEVEAIAQAWEARAAKGEDNQVSRELYGEICREAARDVRRIARTAGARAVAIARGVWAEEADAKSARDLAETSMLAAFYRSCALSGEDPGTPEEALAKVREVRAARSPLPGALSYDQPYTPSIVRKPPGLDEIEALHARLTSWSGDQVAHGRAHLVKLAIDGLTAIKSAAALGGRMEPAIKMAAPIVIPVKPARAPVADPGAEAVFIDGLTVTREGPASDGLGVLPLELDDGTVITCDAISGGADSTAGEPNRLTLRIVPGDAQPGAHDLVIRYVREAAVADAMAEVRATAQDWRDLRDGCAALHKEAGDALASAQAVRADVDRMFASATEHVGEAEDLGKRLRAAVNLRAVALRLLALWTVNVTIADADKLEAEIELERDRLRAAADPAPGELDRITAIVCAAAGLRLNPHTPGAPA